MHSINMKKEQTVHALSIISILSLLTISGCILPGGDTGFGSGVVIENFEVDFPDVYAGETFKLQMKARNVGSVDAYGVRAVIFNTESSSGGEKLSIACGSQECLQQHLLAPDTDRGTSGASMICSWECRAPNVPKGVSVTFNPYVRLDYSYQTNVIKSLTVASQDEIRNIKNQGKSLPSETISSSTGPISMDVRVKGPIRFWEGETSIKFPLEISIINAGGGTACASGGSGMLGGCSETDNWDRVWLTFPEGLATGRSCSGVADNQIVELWKGQDKTVTCEALMPLQWGVSGLVQKNLKFEATYSYFIDASATVTVKGTDI